MIACIRSRDASRGHVGFALTNEVSDGANGGVPLRLVTVSGLCARLTRTRQIGESVQVARQHLQPLHVGQLRPCSNKPIEGNSFNLGR